MSEPPNFAGYKFPPKSNVPWGGPKIVRHLVYKIRQSREYSEERDGLPEKSLRLFKQEETPKPPMTAYTVGEALAIAKDIVTGHGDYPEVGASEIDIDACEQCWLIIELDRKTNWRFSKTHEAATTKEPESKYSDPNNWEGHNADLWYIYDNLHVSQSNNDAPEHVDCHVIVFRVARRVEHRACKINFFVEFYGQREGGKPTGKAMRLVPLIIDPQVPEDPPSFP